MYGPLASWQYPLDPSLTAWDHAAPLSGQRTGLLLRWEEGQGICGLRAESASVKPTAAQPPNLLAYGDNLTVLANSEYVTPESVDLIYLDPPFNSNADYNVLFAEHGVRAAAQIKAFGDTWSWDTVAAASYQATVEQGGDIAAALRAFRTMLGTSDMLAYLSMMAPRLIALRRVLRPTGTIYLHCDPTASHYLKLLMDSIFGPKHFRNEIVWCYAGGGIPKKDFPRKHDTILRYTKSDDYYYKPIYRPYSAGTVQRGRTQIKGKYFAAGLRSEGTPVNDWWTDVPKITSPTDPEKLGYPTQKSLALMARILEASSVEGDVVLDPFCGCGTTIDAAQAMGRRWIGIDITHHATGLIKHRLNTRYGPGVVDTFRVVGEPTTLEDAAVLAKEDPFQFQSWALGLVGARLAGGAKKGGDRGIDGRLFFHEVMGGTSKEIVISVKGGHLVPAFVRDLVGVINREEAAIGVLISFEEPTSGMRAEAASAGFLDKDGRYPRIQLRTVRELLVGRRIAYPTPKEPPATLWPPEAMVPPAAAVARPFDVRVERKVPVSPASVSVPNAGALREEYAAKAKEPTLSKRRLKWSHALSQSRAASRRLGMAGQ